MISIPSPDHTLLLQKGKERTKSSLTHFSMATGDIPWPAKVASKDLGVLDCPGEDGERVFFPDRLPLEAYDLEIEFKYRGALGSLYSAYKAFRQYLTGEDGNGSRLLIYSPYCGIGRAGVYLKSMEPNGFKRDNAGEYMSLKVKFRVTDPVTDIILVEADEG